MNYIYKYSNKELNVNLTANVLTIFDSYIVTKSNDMQDVIEDAKRRVIDGHIEESYGLLDRSTSGLIKEWESHNLLHELHICVERTKNVDLEWPQKWYYKVGYFILSCFY